MGDAGRSAILIGHRRRGFRGRDFRDSRARSVPMQRSNDAYLLGTQPLGEADLILTLLVEGEGIVRGVARSARRSRKRFGGALEPLSRVTLHWTYREGRDLHRIDSLDLTRSFADMQSDPAVQAACAVISEITRILSRENDDDPRVFRLLGAVLDALRGGLDPWAGVRYFEVWMLRLHGLLPDLRECGACRRPLEKRRAFVPRSGDALLCSRCAAEAGVRCRALARDERALLAAVLGEPPAEIAGRDRAARPGGALDWLLKDVIEGFAERALNTYRHLAVVTATHMDTKLDGESDARGRRPAPGKGNHG